MAWMHTVVLLSAISTTGVPQQGQVELLDFTATWCGPCQQMAPIVSQLQAQGYPIRKVDFDQHRDLAAKYRVQAIPCFVLLVNGKEVQRAGPSSAEQLKQMLDAAGAGSQRASANIQETAARSRSRGRAQARAQSPDNMGPTPPTVSFPSQVSETPLMGAPAGVQPQAMQPEAFPQNAAPPSGPTSGHATFVTPTDASPSAFAASQEAMPAAPPRQSPPAVASAGVATGNNDRQTAAQSALSASVRLKIVDAGGNSVGSGTIIDARAGEALILTCGHIFRESKGQGTINVDLFGAGAPRGLQGNLVGYDLDRDVALVSVRPGVAVVAARLAPPGHKIRTGDSVITVGCDNGSDPTALASRVNAIDKFLGPSSPHGPTSLHIAGQPVEGRSGGGLFTTDGLVIGVCNARDPADNEGLFAALGSIYSQLERFNLMQLVAGETELSSAAGAGTASGATREPPSMPEQMPRMLDRERSRDIVQTSAQGPAAGYADAAANAGLARNEAQALDEIRGADGAEVICIVRSLTDPRAKSDVIVLDRASPEFMRQLSADRRVQSSRQMTSLVTPARR